MASQEAGSLASKQRSEHDERRKAMPESVVGYLFVAPALFGFFMFYLVPTFRAFQISLTDWNLLRAPKFIAFANYGTLFADPKFWDSVRLTLGYVAYNIPIQTCLGLLIAVLADRMAKSVLLRAVIIAPYLISNVVAVLIWLLLLDPLLGLTNGWLEFLGLSREPFFSSPGQAMFSVAGVSIWRHVGFTALLFYAGLQSVPRNLYEAANLDGASEARMFWTITLPLLRPVLAFVLVTSVIGSFQVFDVIAVGTQGGPADSTRVILWYIYENAFKFNKMGYASAISMVLFSFLIVVTLIQMRALRAGHSDLD
jgi:multiple sugar transport system permease protein